MKYKYVNSVDYTIYEDDWLDFLNQMLEDGWKLKKIGYLRFRFEPCTQKLKYQIDYTPLNEEYLEALKAMGYEYIDSYSHVHVFASEDLHALDIQTDEAVRIHSLLKLRPLYSIIGLIIFAPLCLLGGIYYIKNYISSLGFIYIQFNDFLLCLLTLFVGVVFLLGSYGIYKDHQNIR